MFCSFFGGKKSQAADIVNENNLSDKIIVLHGRVEVFALSSSLFLSFYKFVIN